MTDIPADRLSLRHIPIDAVAQLHSIPAQKIRTDEDIEAWRTTTGYRDYAVFLRRLNECVVGCFLPWSSPCPTQVSSTANYARNEVELAYRQLSPLSRF